MINITRPVIGEAVEDCREETMTVVESLMVEAEVEECDEVMESVCETEYTQECGCSEAEECEQVLELIDITILHTMFSLQVMVEVCAERRSCETIYVDDCQSRWEGEGASRVWVTNITLNLSLVVREILQLRPSSPAPV